MKKLILALLFVACMSFQASALGPMMMLSGGGSGCVGGSDGAMGGTDSLSDVQYSLIDGDCVMQSYTPSEDGTVTYIHANTALNTGTGRSGIYDSARTSLLAYSGVDASPQTHDEALNEAYCLVSGTTYWLVICGDGDAAWGINYETTGTLEMYNCAGDTWGGVAMPADVSGCTTEYRVDKLMDIWVDNTP